MFTPAGIASPVTRPSPAAVPCPGLHSSGDMRHYHVLMCMITSDNQRGKQSCGQFYPGFPQSSQWPGHWHCKVMLREPGWRKPQFGSHQLSRGWVKMWDQDWYQYWHWQPRRFKESIFNSSCWLRWSSFTSSLVFSRKRIEVLTVTTYQMWEQGTLSSLPPRAFYRPAEWKRK